jgi:nucleoside-triphosphatase THEP1
MIEITVKAEMGMGKNTIASYIAKALHDMGLEIGRASCRERVSSIV